MADKCGFGGRHRLFGGDGDTWTPLQSDWTENTWDVGWGLIACRCLGMGDASYKLGAIYIEYENPASPGDTIAIPTFGARDGLGYYTDMAGSPRRDYLRVPLRSTPAIDAAPGYEALFGRGDGNRLSVFAQTAGAMGVHGLPFTAAAGSTVCGVAVVATPTLADSTRDALFARSYYPVDRQVVKSPNGQIAVSYELIFGPATPP